MIEGIPLAEWIAALRAELTEAVAWQRERIEAAHAAGHALPVPPLALSELKLDIEVSTTHDEGLKGGLKFWVLSTEGEKKRSQSSTQRVTLVLHPTATIHLGDDKGFLDE